MNVVLVAEIGVGIVHVLRCVDVEVLLLLVSDLEQVSLDVARVLSQESTDDWVMVVGYPSHHGGVDGKGKTNPLEESPPESGSSAVFKLSNSLKTSPSTEEPGDSIVSSLGEVKVLHSFSVLKWHVVRKEIAFFTIVIEEGVEPVEAIILYPSLSKPWSS